MKDNQAFEDELDSIKININFKRNSTYLCFQGKMS